MKVLTMQDFLLICRKVVEQLGQHPQMNQHGIPRRINTFVGLIELNLNLQHPSFNANYSDFNRGRFWARDWVAGGADPNSMKGDYPVIMLEERGAVLKNIKSSISKKRIVVYSMDKNSCDGCPPEIKSPHSAYDTALFWFKVFTRKVLEHQVIKLLPSGVELWLTKEEAEEMVEREEIESYQVTGTPMTSWFLQEGEFKLEPWSDNVVNGARGYFTEVFVQVCEESMATFNYVSTDWNRVAVKNCESCG